MISKEEWEQKQEGLREWREGMEKLAPQKIKKSTYTVNPQEQSIKILRISKGATVLDVGCGGGASKQWLHKTDWKGIDPFPPENHTPDITVGMAEDLPFDDKSFDYVICFASLFHFLDPEKAIKEMVRVGKRVGIMTLIWKEGLDVSVVHTHNITEKSMEQWLTGNWSRKRLDYEGANPCYLYQIKEEK